MCENIAEKQCMILGRKYNGQIFRNDKSGLCTLYAGDIGEGNKWKFITKDFTDNNGKTITRLGVQIQFNYGGIHSLENLYQVKFNLYCEEKTEDLLWIGGQFDITQSSNEISFLSKHACEKTAVYVIWNFIKKYQILFASLMILIGLFEMIFGNRYIRATSVIISILAFLLFCVFVLFPYIFKQSSDEKKAWIALAIAVVVGAVLGFLVSIFHKAIISAILGIVCGFCVAQGLYVSVFSRIKTSKPKVIRIVVYVVVIVIFIALSVFLFNVIIIFATSFIGAYSFIRGISIFAGGFPNEATIIDLIEKKEYESIKKLITWKVYVYLAAIVICFIIGLITQFRMKKKDEEEKLTDDSGVKYMVIN